ncbi:NACHT and WD repeat domain-containing protein [Kitasatospora sp. NPDC017646]|uniref:NACHT and WD repeat domain-containing protein n=1 Tax=Kitasatospora sp. NPDC017646 TaxID=3364024 RepID=UPI0037A66791
MTESDEGAVSSGTPPWQPIRLEASATDGGDVFQAVGNITIIRKPEGPNRVRPGRASRDMLCPYPGLMPFSAEYRDWFFGRDQMIHTVLERMDARLREGGPLVLIGPSGAGKSSLLAAGVLPAVRDGRLPVAGSSGWPQLTLTPTTSPAEALAAAAGLGSEEARSRAESWRTDVAQCVADLRASTGAGEGGAPGLLVVVDQFEELFTACADEDERQWFVEVLDQLATGGAAVVLSLRADFYAACTPYPELRTALQAGAVVLGPMTEEELKQAIRLPAELVELEVEEGLVELLLADLGTVGNPAGAGSAGRLPLLAHALRGTWQQRSGNRLTVDGYRVTGGIQRALANTADRLFEALPRPGREMARWVFLRLVTVGRDADDTRRRVRYDDLLRHAPDPDSAGTVVDEFTRGRLLTRDQDAVTITHEVLIRAWPRLREWIEQDRDGNLVRQDLEEAAAAWDQSGREPGGLYRGNRLEIAQAWAERHAPDLSAAAGEFLATARRHQRRGQRLRRGAVALITVLAVTASAAATFAFVQNAHSVRDRNKAIDTAVTSASLQQAPIDPSLSAQLALTAYRLNPDPEAASRLIGTENTPMDIRLQGSTGSVDTVAYSPDGHTLAAGYYGQNTVRLWDVSDPGHPVALGRPLPEDGSVNSINSLAFSPDGRTLAVGGHADHLGDNGSGGFVDLWGLTSPSHPVLLSRPAAAGVGPLDLASPVVSLAFSPDGRTLAAGRAAGVASLWDVTRPGAAAPDGTALDACPDSLYLYSLAFSPGSRTLAAGCADDTNGHPGTGVIGLWNAADPSHLTRQGQPLDVGSALESVAFSPDGRTLAAGAKDSHVHLWNLTDPEHPAQIDKPLAGPADPVMSVAFSPDGHTLAAGSADDTVHLWNVTDVRVISPLGRALSGHGNVVAAVAFSPDSHTLAAGDTDGDVDVWNLPPTQLAGAGGNVASVAFSPDGRTLAAGNQYDTVSLWNTTNPDHPAPRGTPLTGPAQPVDSVAFSPDGRTLAAGDSGGTVTLWNVADPDHPVPLGPPLTGVGGVILSLAFSHDGHTLAAAGDDHVFGGIALWDVSDPAHPAPRSGIQTDHTRSVQSIAFSPDGHALATGGDRTTSEVGLWSTSDQATTVRIGEPVRQPSDTSTWVAFSPDGRTLATGAENGRITLWNSTDLRHLTPRPQVVTVPGDSLWSIAFSPDGRTLAAAGHTTVGSIVRWNVADPDNPRQIGDPLTVTTGPVSVLAFSPDSRTLAATTGDGVATLWDLDVEAAITNICASSAGALNRDNWHLYVPVLGYRSPCRTK